MLLLSNCNLYDNSIQGELNNQSPEIPDATPAPVTPPALKLTNIQAPLDIGIVIDEENRTIAVSNIHRGKSFEILFDSTDSSVSGMVCDDNILGLAVVSGGVRIKGPLKNLEEVVTVSCSTDYGPLVFTLSYNSQSMSVVSSVNTLISGTLHQIGGPGDQWMLITTDAYSLYSVKQIVAQNLSTQELKFISSVTSSVYGFDSSSNPRFSSDGTKVLFTTKSANFPFGDGVSAQVYIKNFADLSQLPVLVSGVDANTPGLSSSFSARFSQDGTKVVFLTSSSNFPLNNGVESQIYIKILNDLSAAPIIVSTLDGSVVGTGNSYSPIFSIDGSSIAFTSRSDNFPSNDGSSNQIYTKSLLDLSLAPILISGVDQTVPGSKSSYGPIFSPDGTKLVFGSSSGNFPWSDDFYGQLYLKDLTDLSVAPVLVSGTSASTVSGWANDPHFSPDGNTLLFTAYVPAYIGSSQSYTKDLTNLSVPHVLISGLDTTTAALGWVDSGVYSADGSTIYFSTTATNFPLYNGVNKIYKKNIDDLSQAPIPIVSRERQINGSGNSLRAKYLFDGSKIVILSNATNFPAYDGNYQLYLKDLNDPAQNLVLVSGLDEVVTANSGIGTYFISPDGLKVVFDTASSNFPSNGGVRQIYMKTFASLTAAPILLSGVDESTAGDVQSWVTDISSDGTKILLSTSSTNFASSNGSNQVYMKDLTDLSLPPIIISALDSNTAGMGNSGSAQFSDSGTEVVFVSRASNFALSNGTDQIYIKNLNDLTQAPIIISRIDSTTAGLEASSSATFSPDGSKIAFLSSASNFPYSNGEKQVYIKDLNQLNSSPVLISGKDTTTPAAGDCLTPQFSPSGDRIMFATDWVSNFSIGGSSHQAFYKYVNDLSIDPILVSGENESSPGNEYARDPYFSPDGLKVIFSSNSSNFPENSSSLYHQIFIKGL